MTDARRIVPLRSLEHGAPIDTVAGTVHHLRPTLRIRLRRLSARVQLAWARYRLRCLVDEVRHYSGKPLVGAEYLMNCETQRQQLRSRINHLESRL